VFGFGLLNDLVWRYCLQFFDTHGSDTPDGLLAVPLATAVLCPFLAGWWTKEKPWFTATALAIAPLIEAGAPRHGYPWQWLLLPILWPYFVQNFGPVYIAYLSITSAGYALRRWLKPFSDYAAVPTASSKSQ
jgi:hypothetical protein